MANCLSESLIAEMLEASLARQKRVQAAQEEQDKAHQEQQELGTIGDQLNALDAYGKVKILLTGRPYPLRHCHHQ